MTKTLEQIITDALGPDFANQPPTARRVIEALKAAHYVIVYREPIAAEDIRNGDQVREEWTTQYGGRRIQEYEIEDADGWMDEGHAYFLTAPRKPQIPDEPGVAFHALKLTSGTPRQEHRFITMKGGDVYRVGNGVTYSREKFIAAAVRLEREIRASEAIDLAKE